jgi:hypothetical protein
VYHEHGRRSPCSLLSPFRQVESSWLPRMRYQPSLGDESEYAAVVSQELTATT